MIWLDMPVINGRRFSWYISLYKRFINDLQVIWTGPAEGSCEFRKVMVQADKGISLDCSEPQQAAVTPLVVIAKRHDTVNVLDLDISLQMEDGQAGTSIRVLLRPYHKPGNTYAYLPFNSFHGRHTFRGWVLAEILRLLTHSGTLEIWKEETSLFYYNLNSRGYPRRFLRTVFQEVTWARRSELLTTNRKKQCDDFFQKYRACVFTLRNAPEWPKLRELLDLNLTELTRTTFGDIFPSRGFLAQCNAPRLGSLLIR